MISGAPPFSSIGFPDGRLPRPLWWRRSEGGRQPFHDTGDHDDYDDGVVQDQDEGDDEGKEVNDMQTRQWVSKSANHNLQDKPCSNKNRAKRKSSKQLNPYLRNMAWVSTRIRFWQMSCDMQDLKDLRIIICFIFMPTLSFSDWAISPFDFSLPARHNTLMILWRYFDDTSKYFKIIRIILAIHHAPSELPLISGNQDLGGEIICFYDFMMIFHYCPGFNMNLIFIFRHVEITGDCRGRNSQ